jgi:glycogen synthase
MPDREALRVLVVTPRYFPYMGGVENHVYQVTRRLAARGVQVTLLTTDPRQRLPAHEQNAGVEIRRVPSWPAREDLFFAPQVYSQVLSGNWDVVHVQSYHTLVAPLAMLAARQAGLPYLVTFHGGGHSSPLRSRLRGAHRGLLRPLLRGAQRLVATARFEIEAYGRELGLPPERFALIPNGSDLDLAGPPPPRQPGLIASLGRLERYKGHQHILAAMPHILARAPHARLWIAGEGPYRPELERLARRLGVSRQVDIHAVPAAQRATWAAQLRRVSLAVLMSEFETHPMALLEALACGCQALVADTSGLSELAQDGYAAAVPLGSPPERTAAQALALLERSPASRPAPPLPSWEACTTALLDLYTAAASRTCANLRTESVFERAES